ncbi:hypothetical protein ABPG72_000274 [Tetrahymena utriculariae]
MSVSSASNDLNFDLLTQFIHIAEIEIAQLKVQEAVKLESNNIQPETASFSQQQTQQQNLTYSSNDQKCTKQEESEGQKQTQNSNNNISEVKKKNLKPSSNSQEKTTKVSSIKKKKISKTEKPQITNTVNQGEKKNRRSNRNVKKSQKSDSSQKYQKKKTNKLSESQLEQFKALYQTNTNSFLMKKFGISRHQLFRYKDKFGLIKDLTFIQKMIQNRDKSQNLSNKKTKQSDEIADDFENEDSKEIVNEEDNSDYDNDIDDDDDIDIQVKPEIEDDVQEKNLNQDQVKKSTLLQSKNHFNPSNEELENQIKTLHEENCSSTQTQINLIQLNSRKQARYKFI